ncbi:MAG: ankyrin repeat domain-containing protein [Alphaproteobacteria bacterium]|nr:ankyrin repeat domain-containing protein [Alphaproteobacteria bacterium]
MPSKDQRNSRTRTLFSILSFPVFKENEDACIDCVKDGADVNAQASKGHPAFVVAAEKGYTRLLEVMLDKGADINMQAEMKGYTALLMAVHKERVETVKFLLAQGADMDIKTSWGMTPRSWAAVHGGRGMLSLFEAEDRRRVVLAFQAAAEKGTVRARKIKRAVGVKPLQSGHPAGDRRSRKAPGE